MSSFSSSSSSSANLSADTSQPLLKSLETSGRSISLSSSSFCSSSSSLSNSSSSSSSRSSDFPEVRSAISGSQRTSGGIPRSDGIRSSSSSSSYGNVVADGEENDDDVYIPIAANSCLSPLSSSSSTSSSSSFSSSSLRGGENNEEEKSHRMKKRTKPPVAPRFCFICLEDEIEKQLVSCCSQCYAVVHKRCWCDWRMNQRLASIRSRLLGHNPPNPFSCTICKTGTARVYGVEDGMQWALSDDHVQERLQDQLLQTIARMLSENDEDDEEPAICSGIRALEPLLDSPYSSPLSSPPSSPSSLSSAPTGMGGGVSVDPIDLEAQLLVSEEVDATPPLLLTSSPSLLVDSSVFSSFPHTSTSNGNHHFSSSSLHPSGLRSSLLLPTSSNSSLNSFSSSHARRARTTNCCAPPPSQPSNATTAMIASASLLDFHRFPRDGREFTNDTTGVRRKERSTYYGSQVRREAEV